MSRPGKRWSDDRPTDVAPTDDEAPSVEARSVDAPPDVARTDSPVEVAPTDRAPTDRAPTDSPVEVAPSVDAPSVEAPTDSPVEVYLDRLLAAAPGSPRDVRALLSEAEAHLRDATAEGVKGGLAQAEAERRAVARFGKVRSVASAEAHRSSLPFAALARRVGVSGLLLGAIGGIAIGVSGIITAILGALGGSTFIVDISPGSHLAPADCARWLANDPGAHSCYQAALSDWASEIVGFRLIAGVAGLVALAAFYLVRRRWTSRQRFETLPAPVVDTIAVTLFGLAGAWMLGLGVDWLAVGHNGAGQWLGAAPVALALGGYYGFRLLRDLQQAPVASS